MTLIAILIATLAAGIGSVWAAALLMRIGLGGRPGVGPQHLLSLAAKGRCLPQPSCTYCPRPSRGGLSAHNLFATLAAGRWCFSFCWTRPSYGTTATRTAPGSSTSRHGHSHDDNLDHGHSHTRGTHATPPPRATAGSWALLTGDSVHCFGDGILIASAFMADMRPGGGARRIGDGARGAAPHGRPGRPAPRPAPTGAWRC